MRGKFITAVSFLIGIMLIVDSVVAFDLGDISDIREKINEIRSNVRKIINKTRYADVKIHFFGTDYVAGEKGTIWLQLLRNYQPINNATCHVTAYYPNKTKLLDNVLMNYLDGSDGLYYYDLTVPEQTGVYMLSASCYLPRHAFIDDFLNYSKLEDWENVTIESGEIRLNDSVLCGGTPELCGERSRVECHDGCYWNQQIGLCMGTPTPCEEYTDQSSCENQLGCTWVGIEITSGFIQSVPIDLESDRWMNFWAEYELNEGNITFEVLNETNDTICTGLGDIQECADGISPIKLRANLSRVDPFGVSPEIFRWGVTWAFETIEEIKGCGEMHVSPVVENVTEVCNPKETWKFFKAMEIGGVPLSDPQECLNETHLRVHSEHNICVGSDCFPLTSEEIVECPFGCDTKLNECRPDPRIRILYAIGIIIFLAVVLLLIRRWLR